MATRAEESSTKDRPEPLHQFQTWLQTIDAPPDVWLGDRDAVQAAVWGAFLPKFRQAVEAAAAQPQADDAAADPDADAAPPGWDDDTLLRMMQESDKAQPPS